KALQTFFHRSRNQVQSSSGHEPRSQGKPADILSATAVAAGTGSDTTGASSTKRGSKPRKVAMAGASGGRFWSSRSSAASASAISGGGSALPSQLRNHARPTAWFLPLRHGLFLGLLQEQLKKLGGILNRLPFFEKSPCDGPGRSCRRLQF